MPIMYAPPMSVTNFPMNSCSLASFIAPSPSAGVEDELRRDVDRVRQRVAHGRFAVDRLLAAPDLLFGRRALDGDRVADVGEAVADRLVVAEQAPEIDVRFHVDVDAVERHAEQRGVARDPRRHAAGERRHQRLRRGGGGGGAAPGGGGGGAGGGTGGGGGGGG